ncbi:hypothetical protein, partial [Nocardia sp. NPDC058497]|uniref:hypothetical protein n=1 Tax=Nocardia sp. NPDC058497 TaxID=3346529 RepID=UPI003669FCD0
DVGDVYEYRVIDMSALVLEPAQSRLRDTQPTGQLSLRQRPVPVRWMMPVDREDRSDLLAPQGISQLANPPLRRRYPGRVRGAGTLDAQQASADPGRGPSTSSAKSVSGR